MKRKVSHGFAVLMALAFATGASANNLEAVLATPGGIPERII